MYAESYRGRFFGLWEVKAAIRSQPFPPRDKHSHKLHNMKSASSQCNNILYQLGILFARSPKFTLNFRYVILPLSLPSISLIWFRTRIIGNSEVPYYAVSFSFLYFLHVGPQSPTRHTVLILCSFLNVTDHVAGPYRTTGKQGDQILFSPSLHSLSYDKSTANSKARSTDRAI